MAFLLVTVTRYILFRNDHKGSPFLLLSSMDYTPGLFQEVGVTKLFLNKGYNKILNTVMAHYVLNY